MLLTLVLVQSFLMSNIESKCPAQAIFPYAVSFLDYYEPYLNQLDLDHPVNNMMQDFGFPIVQSHTYEHRRWRNVLMWTLIGVTLFSCTFFGFIYSLIFDIQGWYWDCVDNAR